MTAFIYFLPLPGVGVASVFVGSSGRMREAAGRRTPEKNLDFETKTPISFRKRALAMNFAAILKVEVSLKCARIFHTIS